MLELKDGQVYKNDSGVTITIINQYYYRIGYPISDFPMFLVHMSTPSGDKLIPQLSKQETLRLIKNYECELFDTFD